MDKGKVILCIRLARAGLFMCEVGMVIGLACTMAAEEWPPTLRTVIPFIFSLGIMYAIHTIMDIVEGR